MFVVPNLEITHVSERKLPPTLHRLSGPAAFARRNPVELPYPPTLGVAWEAPVASPKICLHTQQRYSRAVPVWELQAPENWFTLSTLLKVLDMEVDSECVLTVRKIHKLGLSSASILREHFSQFGEVERVMLLPSRPKSSPLSNGGNFVKIRPASMAFVVMRSRQPAIIARLFEVHSVEGHLIQVQKFRIDQSCSSEESPFGNYSWLDETLTSIDYTPPSQHECVGRKNSYAAQVIN